MLDILSEARMMGCKLEDALTNLKSKLLPAYEKVIARSREMQEICEKVESSYSNSAYIAYTLSIVSSDWFLGSEYCDICKVLQAREVSCIQMAMSVVAFSDVNCTRSLINRRSTKGYLLS